MKAFWKYALIILGALAIDQASKLLIHYYMVPGQEIDVLGDWFRLHYVENPGMSFGVVLGGVYGKLILTSARILAIGFLIAYAYRLTQRRAHPGLILSITLVIAGALGNAFDSIFYGVLLDNATHGALTPWFHGQVVDMFYFPIAEGQYPNWVPGLGGSTFRFFRHIFNVADAFIFCGVVIILARQRTFFFKDLPETQTAGHPVEHPAAE